jgi:hypothetical protein
MIAEAPDRTRPVSLVFVVGVVAAALAGGYLVRVLMSEQ